MNKNQAQNEKKIKWRKTDKEILTLVLVISGV